MEKLIFFAKSFSLMPSLFRLALTKSPNRRFVLTLFTSFLKVDMPYDVMKRGYPVSRSIVPQHFFLRASIILLSGVSGIILDLMQSYG